MGGDLDERHVLVPAAVIARLQARLLEVAGEELDRPLLARSARCSAFIFVRGHFARQRLQRLERDARLGVAVAAGGGGAGGGEHGEQREELSHLFFRTSSRQGGRQQRLSAVPAHFKRTAPTHGSAKGLGRDRFFLTLRLALRNAQLCALGGMINVENSWAFCCPRADFGERRRAEFRDRRCAWRAG
jgi:hypothetical protein